jgi:hypothetical protein
MYVQTRMLIRKFLSSPRACNEGELRSMYPDNLGNVTTGVGNLLASVADANSSNGIPLRWENIATKATATPAEVGAEFARVTSAETKARIPNWAAMGGGNFITAARNLGIVTLQLTQPSLTALFESKLASFERAIKGTPGHEDFDKIPAGFPADAELGIIGVIWGWGPGRFGGAQLREFNQMCGARQWGDISARKTYRWSNIRADRDQTLVKVFANAQKVEDQLRMSPTADVTIVSPPFSDLF